MRYFDRKSAGRLRRQRGRSARLKAVLGAVLIAGTMAGGAWGFRSLEAKGCFNVRTVVISGQRMVDEAGITEQANQLVGKPLWKAGYSRVASQLVRRHPAIRQTSFRAWPWGRVELSIRERKPVAIIHQGNGSLIDGEGVVFKPDSTRAWEGWEKTPQLIITGCSQAGIWRALRLIESAPWVEPDWLFDPSHENDIRLWLPGGVGVHFGNGDFARQWQKLGEVLASLEGEGQPVCQIDLRPRGQAVVRGLPGSKQAGQ